MNQSLSQLADHSRVWIFQADRFLNESELTVIKKKMNEFMPTWAAHGNDLYGGYNIENKLFLIVGVDETRSPASGCSIDSLTRLVKDLGAELAIDFFNRLAISYEDERGEIQLVSMNEFKRLAGENEVNSNTIVYNNLVNSKGEFDSKWRTQVKHSWHINLFQLI